VTEQAPAKTTLARAARVDAVSAYIPPPVGPHIKLRLDANEGPAPDDALMQALRRVDAETLRRYPRPADLEARIADHWQVPAGRVVVTSGGDDAIDRVAHATLEPGRTLLTHAPTFPMIPRAAKLAGGDVEAVEWLDGPFPAGDFASSISKQTGLVAVVSPNNPTGGAVEPEALLDLADRAAAAGIAFMADLAYVEFADEDPTPALLERPNTVVIRTFSKALGLAGLRVGYAIASEEIAGWLRAVGAPYPVAGPSLAIAGAALERGDPREAGSVQRVREERGRLSELLNRLGLAPLPAQANFVTARTPDAESWASDLAAEGIAVRPQRDAAGSVNLLRITLPGEAAAYDFLSKTLRGVHDRRS